MKFIGRFIGYYILNIIVSFGVLFLYGYFDPFAGYYVLVLPITGFFATLIMLYIRNRFESMNRILFFLLSPIINVLCIVGLFVILILTEQGS